MTSQVHKDFLKQHDALRAAAGWVDVSQRTQIEVQGKDRARFLNNFCTNDIVHLSPNEGCEAFFTSVQGKVLGHGCIFCGAESLTIETVADQAEPLIAHLDRYLIREEVSLLDRSRPWGELLISGPNAPALVEELVGRQLTQTSPSQIEVTWEETPLLIRRAAIAGPHTVLISASSPAVAEFIKRLVEHAVPQCGLDALESRRVESGWPYYGIDITDQNLAQEVGRNDQAINLKKGCYLGQETVARIDALGHVNRRLVGLRLRGTECWPSQTELQHAGRAVGHVTSCAYSPILQGPLALGYVRRGHEQTGNVLHAAFGTAEVIQLPVSHE